MYVRGDQTRLVALPPSGRRRGCPRRRRLWGGSAQGVVDACLRATCAMPARARWHTKKKCEAERAVSTSSACRCACARAPNARSAACECGRSNECARERARGRGKSMCGAGTRRLQLRATRTCWHEWRRRRRRWCSVVEMAYGARVRSSRRRRCRSQERAGSDALEHRAGATAVHSRRRGGSSTSAARLLNKFSHEMGSVTPSTELS